MKKILFAIFATVLTLLSGCKSIPGNTENTVTEKQGVQFSEIDDYDIDKEREFEIDLSTMSFWKNAKPIETKEYAVMYGNAIIEECHRNGKNTDFKLLSVLHLKQRNIWHFFWPRRGPCYWLPL